ncbi:MAG: hypothetical protein ACI9LY_000020 [Arenicella sp.]|jgi:hypothetical protein
MFAALLLRQNAAAAGKWILGVKVGKIDNNVEQIKDAVCLDTNLIPLSVIAAARPSNWRMYRATQPIYKA